MLHEFLLLTFQSSLHQYHHKNISKYLNLLQKVANFYAQVPLGMLSYKRFEFSSDMGNTPLQELDSKSRIAASTFPNNMNRTNNFSNPMSF